MTTNRDDDALLLDLDATGQAELIRKGELRPLDLVDAAAARIEKLDPLVHALAAFDPGPARQQVCRWW